MEKFVQCLRTKSTNNALSTKKSFAEKKKYVTMDISDFTVHKIWVN